MTTPAKDDQQERDTGKSHLEVCPACRELDRLWEELTEKQATQAGPPRQADPQQQDTQGSGTMLGKRATARGRQRGELPEANRCPGCGGWKRPQYETCFRCSGQILCAVCGQKYHDDQYDRCYECNQARYG